MERNDTHLSNEHIAVLEALRNSDDKYTTRRQLLLRLDKGESYTRYLRKIINDLIVFHGCMIGSTRQDGYYICENKEDVERAIYTLSSNNEGLLTRIEALRRKRDERFD